MRKYIKLSIVFSIVLSMLLVCMPSVYADSKVDSEKVLLETNSLEDSKSITLPESYIKQSLLTLHKDNKVTVDSETVTIEDHTAGEGILVSGNTSDVTNAKFTIDKTFSFDSAPARFTVDGLAAKRKNLTVSFYLDDEEEPFVSQTLKKSKKDKTWTYQGDLTQFLTREITGDHTVSFKVATTDTDKTMSFLMRSIEFVADTRVPTLSFNIDESEGTIAEMNSSDDHSAECYGNMTIRTPKGYTAEYTGKTTTEVKEETFDLDYIRGRGNSTWYTDKKPYKVKLAKKQNLFGMGKNKHWVLLANRYDNSQLRNKLTYWMGEQLGLEFNMQSIPVDVIMNGVYYGSYQLCEQVRVDDNNRVAIDDLENDKEATEEPTITGGYLLSTSYETDADESNPGNTFKTDRGNCFDLESPDFVDEGYFNRAQYDYIKNYMNRLEDAIYNLDTHKNADGESYADMMDVDAAVRYFWMQEFTMNGDAYGTTSTYLYKKRNGLLYWGPLWDFDYVAWGDTEYDEFYTEGFNWMHSHIKYLLLDNAFLNKMKTFYTEKYLPVLEEAFKEGGQLDQYAEALEISNFYDREKLGVFLDNYDEYSTSQRDPITFREEIQRFKDWVAQRKTWVSAHLNEMKPNIVTVTFKDGKTVTKKVLTGEDGIGTLPDAAVKKGYVFIGWFNGSERIDETSVFRDDATVTAKYVKESSEIKAKKLYLTCYKIKDYYNGSSQYYDYQIGYTIMPENTTVQKLTWSSSNEDVVVVDQSGRLFYKGVGTATITAKTKNGIKKTFKVTLIDAKEAVESDNEFGLNKYEMTLNEGSYAKLTPQYSDDHMGAYFSFSSDNSDIAEVTESGVVIAKKPGTCYIEVYDDSSEDTQMCYVIVKEVAKKGKRKVVGDITFKITKVAKGKKKGAVAVVNAANKATITIPKTIKVAGKTYNVTSIAKNALKGKKKIRKIIIEAKTIKSIGKNAIKGIYKKAKIIVPSAKARKYKKLFKKSTGYRKSMKMYKESIKKIK